MGERERSLLYELSKVRPGEVLGIDSAVSEVDRVLVAGETPRAVVWGKFENGRFGLLVATDSRLIALDKGVITRTLNVREIPYDVVKVISNRVGLVLTMGEITVLTFPSGGLSIGLVQKDAASVFAGWVRNRIGARSGDTEIGPGSQHSSLASLGVTPQFLADELTKLAALRDSGSLSEAEFLEAKKRLLSE